MLKFIVARLVSLALLWLSYITVRFFRKKLSTVIIIVGCNTVFCLACSVSVFVMRKRIRYPAFNCGFKLSAVPYKRVARAVVISKWIVSRGKTMAIVMNLQVIVFILPLVALRLSVSRCTCASKYFAFNHLRFI